MDFATELEQALSTLCEDTASDMVMASLRDLLDGDSFLVMADAFDEAGGDYQTTIARAIRCINNREGLDLGAKKRQAFNDLGNIQTVLQAALGRDKVIVNIHHGVINFTMDQPLTDGRTGKIFVRVEIGIRRLRVTSQVFDPGTDEIGGSLSVGPIDMLESLLAAMPGGRSERTALLILVTVIIQGANGSEDYGDPTWMMRRAMATVRSVRRLLQEIDELYDDYDDPEELEQSLARITVKIGSQLEEIAHETMSMHDNERGEISNNLLDIKINEPYVYQDEDLLAHFTRTIRQLDSAPETNQ